MTSVTIIHQHQLALLFFIYLLGCTVTAIMWHREFFGNGYRFISRRDDTILRLVVVSLSLISWAGLLSYAVLKLLTKYVK